mmetsp:Transcript_12263/g.16645  ORF Transcript_12263/g.16645 Transcript_12263/m.16645 type:complete len:342 (+) Transcript_12263:219-1244(+)
MVTVIIFLAILSTMLIYSLMLQDVSSKTYEFGMLRALGFRLTNLVEVVSIKSMSFSIPGFFFGIIIASSFNVLLREVLFISSLNYLGYELTTFSIWLGVCFGFFMPLIANFLPVKASMSTNLRNSLDLTRTKDEGVGVKIEKLEEIGISANQIGVAFILIFVGTLTYYGVPLSFLNANYFMAFLILSLILIMVIIGLTFMCTLVFSYMERLLLWITLNTCCRRDRLIHSVIRKQMDGHRLRNNKTSIMFTLSVAFLFFSASSFQLLVKLVLKGYGKQIGSDIFVWAPVGLLEEAPLREYLTEKKNAKEQLVADFAFTSVPLKTSLKLGSENGTPTMFMGPS